MSGVQSGTRLERLEQLHRQIHHEITAERRRLALDDAGQRRVVISSSPRRSSDLATQDRLFQLGVTSRQVKVWAVQKGLIPAVARGRLARWIVEAYAAAHP